VCFLFFFLVRATFCFLLRVFLFHIDNMFASLQGSPLLSLLSFIVFLVIVLFSQKWPMLKKFYMKIENNFFRNIAQKISGISQNLKVCFCSFV